MQVVKGLARACSIMKGWGMTRKTGWHNGGNTSNWKEGTNINVKAEELAEELAKELAEELAKEHKLDNGELLITDNQVFEGCFYKGNYNSRNLIWLVLILKLVEMTTGWIFHVIHVTGTINKQAGIYGLSQGNLLEGMMTVQNPLLLPYYLHVEVLYSTTYVRTDWYWNYRNRSTALIQQLFLFVVAVKLRPVVLWYTPYLSDQIRFAADNTPYLPDKKPEEV